MNHTHNANNNQLSALFKLLAGCLLPIVLIFIFAAMGVEHYSIGGFVPYLMLLFCPIAYFMAEYPKVTKQKIIDEIQRKLNS